MFVLFGGLIKHQKYVSMKPESPALMKFIFSYLNMKCQKFLI